MGNVDASKGVKQEGFQLLCRLLAEGELWRAFHEALVKANPEQLIWGTDWPHPRLAEEEMPDDGHLLDLFNAWTLDAATRRRILVENPVRLFGFKHETVVRRR